MDPKGFPAGDASLYRYVGNSPTNAIDPTGLDIVRIADDKVGTIIWTVDEGNSFWDRFGHGVWGASLNLTDVSIGILVRGGGAWPNPVHLAKLKDEFGGGYIRLLTLQDKARDL